MQLVKLNNAGVAVMSSMELAEFTGKRHDNLLRDIRKMFTEIGQQDTLLNFEERRLVKINEHDTKEYKCYGLPEKEALFVAAKFRDDIRWKIIEEFEKLRKKELQPMSELAMIAAIATNAEAQRVKLIEQGERIDEIEKWKAALPPPVKVVEVPAGYKAVTDIHRDHAPWLSLEKVKATLDNMNWNYTLYTAVTAGGHANTKARAYELVRGNLNKVTVQELFDRIRREAIPATNLYWTHRFVPGRFMIG